MKRLIMSLISLVLLIGCASSLPDWYQHREDYYPEKDYVVSEGWGATPDKAVEKAAINMAQFFKTRVTVEKNILKRYESVSDMKAFEEYMTEFSEEMATLIADENLVNIMFVEPAYDRRTRSFYTVAYMPRVETAMILMDRIKREQEHVDNYVRKAEISKDVVGKYHYYTNAWLSASRRQMMQEQLDILLPGAKITTYYSLSELEILKDKASENITFAIKVTRDVNGRIQHALKTAVNRAGFKTSDIQPELNMTANTLIKNIEIDQESLSFVSWELQIQVKKQNETILSMMEEGREGSTNADNARTHAYESMQAYIEKTLSAELTAYFDQMDK